MNMASSFVWNILRHPQSIVTNTAIASAGRLVNIIAGIVATALITRYLGVGQYGVFSFLLSLGAILQITADFGLYLTLARDIAQNPERKQRIYSSIAALRVVLLGGVFICGLVVLILIPSYRDLWLPFTVIAVGLSAQSLSQLLMGIYQATSHVWQATLGDLVGRVLQLVGIALFPILRSQFPISAVVYMAAAFTIGAVTAYLLHGVLLSAVHPWRLTLSWQSWKHLAKTSWPLGAMLVVNAIYFRIDIVMLSYLRSDTEVGLYGLAYRVIESGLFFPAMFGGLLLPHVSSALTQHRELAQKIVYQSLHAVSLAAVWAVAVLVIYAQPIVLFLSGSTFLPAAPLLRVLAMALGIMFFGNVFGFTLVALQQQKQLMYLYCFLAAGNIMANLIYIPLYGPLAAAWTTVGTELIAMLAAGFLVWRTLAFRFPARTFLFATVAAASSLLATFSFLEPWHIIWRVAFPTLIYVGLLFWLGLLRGPTMHMLFHRPKAVISNR